MSRLTPEDIEGITNALFDSLQKKAKLPDSTSKKVISYLRNVLVPHELRARVSTTSTPKQKPLQHWENPEQARARMKCHIADMLEARPDLVQGWRGLEARYGFWHQNSAPMGVLRLLEEGEDYGRIPDDSICDMMFEHRESVLPSLSFAPFLKQNLVRWMLFESEAALHLLTAWSTGHGLEYGHDPRYKRECLYQARSYGLVIPHDGPDTPDKFDQGTVKRILTMHGGLAVLELIKGFKLWSSDELELYDENVHGESPEDLQYTLDVVNKIAPSRVDEKMRHPHCFYRGLEIEGYDKFGEGIQKLYHKYLADRKIDDRLKSSEVYKVKTVEIRRDSSLDIIARWEDHSYRETFILSIPDDDDQTLHKFRQNAVHKALMANNAVGLLEVFRRANPSYRAKMKLEYVAE